MRSRMLVVLLIAVLVAFAVPGPGEAMGDSHGGGHSSSSHSSGGRSSSGSHPSGGHTGSGGHPGHGGGSFHPGWGPHGGVPYHGGGHFGWHGGPGWGGAYLSFPFWWDSSWWWGWPYGAYPYYGSYYPYGGYDGSWDLGVAPGPSDSMIAEPDAEEDQGEDTSEPAAPAPGTSQVDLQISPATALVVLNGVVIGSVDEFGHATDVLYLDAGEYTLEFRAPGFRTRRLPLRVSGGDSALLYLSLRADPAAGAERAAPPSPGLPHGRRFGPSFGPGTGGPGPAAATGSGVRAIAARPGSTGLALRVSPPGAAVYVDGALIGTGDQLANLPDGVAVAPGPHRIDIVAPGHAGKTIQIDAQAGKTTELSVALE